MKEGILTYKYAKWLNGKGRYGAVSIQIHQTNSRSTITDLCEWTTFREAYPNFVELGILKIWKQSAINASAEVIKNVLIPDKIEIVIKDVMGLYVDTCPSHIGAAIIIGIYDYCGLPLNHNDLQLLDEFVEKNDDIDTIPDYTQLNLTTTKKA
jgi:hypothetical protein